ncbi:MAG: tetratricopeptide repeat protein [Coriobacteriia bacterium]|nr:tetratricopeptide repeat protein [Coriobacteriia bacterium]
MHLGWSERVAKVTASILLVSVLLAGVGLAYVLTLDRAPSTLVEAVYADALAKVEAEPDDYEARIELAKALGAAGQYRKAVTQLEIAAELSPEDPEPHTLMGVIYRMAGDTDKAIAAHEKAVTLPDGMGDVYLESYYELGQLYVDEGEYDKAVEAFEQALVQGPELVYVAVALADAYEKAGDIEAAYEEYVRILPTAPGNPEIESAFARLQDALGEAAEEPDDE